MAMGLMGPIYNTALDVLQWQLAILQQPLAMWLFGGALLDIAYSLTIEAMEKGR